MPIPPPPRDGQIPPGGGGGIPPRLGTTDIDCLPALEPHKPHKSVQIRVEVLSISLSVLLKNTEHFHDVMRKNESPFRIYIHDIEKRIKIVNSKLKSNSADQFFLIQRLPSSFLSGATSGNFSV